MAKTYKSILTEYQERYDLEGISNPNDKSNLDMLINNQIIISAIQDEVQQTIKNGDIADNATAIAKLQQTLQSLIELSLQIERALGIDRKSRKKDNQEDVGQYIQMIKSNARQWLETHLIYVYCPQCKVMLGRILPAHEHTSYDVEFQCSQCGKFGRSIRKEKDIFFDLKERNKEWRRKYPVEIEAPSIEDQTGDELVLGDGESDA